MQLQGNKTVLLVEDEAPRAAETCARLRDFGYAVLSAPSGEKALEVLATKQGIDLVLLDIDLGLGREGPSMASRILGSRDLPLVLLASHSGQEPVEKLEGITRYGYVVKDSGEAALRSTIETAFELFEARRRAEKEAGESRLLFQDLKADFAATDELMKLIQGCEGRDELMKRVLSFMRDISGCEAVGIRLSLDGDYPYYVHRGFPEDFIRTERSLCARDPEGAIIRDEIGNPVLDCMCGNILCGRFDPSKPFFTQGGASGPAALQSSWPRPPRRTGRPGPATAATARATSRWPSSHCEAAPPPTASYSSTTGSAAPSRRAGSPSSSTSPTASPMPSPRRSPGTG